MHIDSLQHAEQVLSQYYAPSTTKYSLKNMRALMRWLGDPQDSLRVIHVAGTSGKTSTAYYTAALLCDGKTRVGLSVSPHVDSITERLQINGKQISQADFCDLLSKFIQLIAKAPVRPSYFELLTALSFWYFAKQDVDFAVIEVGLGGLLDATNVIRREDKICVITDIGLDHVEVFGDSLRQIATQKAGIITARNQVVMHSQTQEVLQVITDTCKKRDATLHIVTQNSDDFMQLPLIQRRNFSVACAAAQLALNGQVAAKVIDAALCVKIPARIEYRKYKGRPIVVDGAHNAQKLTGFFSSLPTMPARDVWVLCAFVQQGSGVRWHESLDVISLYAKNLVIVQFSAGPKQSVPAKDIAQYAESHGMHVVDVGNDIPKGLDVVTANGKRAVVTGSFYIMHTVHELLDA